LPWHIEYIEHKLTNNNAAHKDELSCKLLAKAAKENVLNLE